MAGWKPYPERFHIPSVLNPSRVIGLPGKIGIGRPVRGSRSPVESAACGVREWDVEAQVLPATAAPTRHGTQDTRHKMFRCYRSVHPATHPGAADPGVVPAISWVDTAQVWSLRNTISLFLSTQGSTMFSCTFVILISTRNLCQRCSMVWYWVRCTCRSLIPWRPAPARNLQSLSPASGHANRSGHSDLCAFANVVALQLSLPQGQRYNNFFMTSLN
jgi:hypothetical protein